MADNTSKDASLQSTKQMLDELDALMERMLSLPVSELEEELEKPPATGKGPLLTASLTLLGPDDGTTAGEDMPRGSALARPAPTPPKKLLDRRAKKGPHPPTQPPHLLKQVAKTEPLKAAPLPPPPPPEPLTNEVMPPSVLPTLDPSLTQAPRTTRTFSPVALAIGPVLWINHAYDQSTKPLGAFGRWMQSHAARSLLGFAGIALMLGTAGWILKDWLGWNL